MAQPQPLTYANARDLAHRIESGAPAEGFASASPKEPQRLHALGTIEAPHNLAENRLVVAVPAASPARDLGVLTRPGTRVVIEAAGIPLGDYTRELLRRLDALLSPGFARVTLANVVHQEQTVDAVARRLHDGEADAAVLYATDTHASDGRLHAIEIPPNVMIRAQYVIAQTRGSPPAARDWLTLTLGPTGRKLLRAAGFVV